MRESSQKQWDALALATNLASFLRSPVFTFPCNFVGIRGPLHEHTPRTEIKPLVRVRGHLNLSHGELKTQRSANCSFDVYSIWRQFSPTLNSQEHWIQRFRKGNSSKWHVNSDETLCYMLNEQWSDFIANIETKHGTSVSIDDAAFFAINNTRWLLWHHLFGYQNGIVNWPSDWPEWPHYEDGVQAYRKAQLKGQLV